MPADLPDLPAREHVPTGSVNAELERWKTRAQKAEAEVIRLQRQVDELLGGDPLSHPIPQK